MGNVVSFESQLAKDARYREEMLDSVRADMEQVDALLPMEDWEKVKFGMLEAINAGVDRTQIKLFSLVAENAQQLREVMLTLSRIENDKAVNDDYAG